MRIPATSALWHVGKLVRRGVVGVANRGKNTRYAVPKTLLSPIHASFVQIVRHAGDAQAQNANVDSPVRYRA